eukprot:gene1189-10703_t
MKENGEEESLIQESRSLQKKEDEKIETPLPWFQILSISFILFCESYNAQFLFPFVGYLVLDFGMVKNETEVGFYTGILTAAFYLGQFISSLIIGYLADKTGKKSILIVGQIFANIFMISFGGSTNFYFAVIFRFLLGIFNGNVTTAKSYVGEITDGSNQAKAWSILGFAWGAGGIVGPSISGLLSRPVKSYPNIFKRNSIWDRFPYLIPNLICSIFMSIGLLLSIIFLKNNNSIEKKKSIKEEFKQISKILTRNSIFSIIVFMVSTFIYSMATEIFGIWAILPLEEGGLNFNPSNIGIVQSIQSFIFLLGQLLIYNLIVKFIGKLNSFRIGFLFFSLVGLTPLLNLLSFNQYLLWVLIVIWSIVRTIGMILTATTTNIFLLNAVPSNLQGLMMGISQSGSCVSRIIGQLSAGYLLAISKSISMKMYLLDVFIPFIIIGIFSILNILLTLPITNSINFPKPEEKEEHYNIQ